MTEELLVYYLAQDGSARKHPFPIDAQLGSLKKTYLHGFYIILTLSFLCLLSIVWLTVGVISMDMNV